MTTLKTLSLWIVLLVTVFGGLEVRAEPPAVGEKLPDEAAAIPLVDTAGRESDLDKLKGPGGLLVVFTANTCAYSVDWRDRIPTLGLEAIASDVGMALVNSNARKRKTDDSAQEMAAQVEQFFPDVAYWIDQGSRLADALGATRTPEVFLFDGDMRLVYHGVIDDFSGPIEKVEGHFARDALRALSSGSDPPASTAPLGCAILRPRKRRPKPTPPGLTPPPNPGKPGA